MPAFRVKEAVQKKDVPDGKYGPKQVIGLVLQEYGVQETVAAEWYTNPGPLPTPGSTLEGDISPSEYGLKFKKTPPAGGFGGGFRPAGRSPEDTKQIVRQHSQEMALRYAAIRGQQGVLPEEFSMASLRAIIDWFQRDAEEGWKPAPAPLPGADVQTDIPDNGVPSAPSPEELAEAQAKFEQETGAK